MTGFDPLWWTAIILGVVFVLVLLGLWAGWRAKQRAQADIPAPPAAHAVDGAPVDRLDDVHYVATTLDERPLERIVRGPLAFRGRCRLDVLSDGVRVAINGTEPFAIPAHAIDAVGTRTATIDRAVERDGLTSISWRLGAGDELEVPVHTQFRIVDPDDRARIRRSLGTLRPDLNLPTQESR